MMSAAMRFWNIFGLVWIAIMWVFWLGGAGEVAVGVAAILATQCIVAADILEALSRRNPNPLQPIEEA